MVLVMVLTIMTRTIRQRAILTVTTMTSAGSVPNTAERRELWIGKGLGVGEAEGDAGTTELHTAYVTLT
jgi:hypothetical protein